MIRLKYKKSRYDNDKIYENYEVEEECSGLTSGARWAFGSEYFSITVTYRIPKGMLNRENEREISNYIDKHIGEFGFSR